MRRKNDRIDHGEEAPALLARGEPGRGESEELFRGVFEHAQLGLCVGEMEGRLLQVNEAFCRMVGYSEEELLDRTWMDLTHTDDLDTALRNREQLSQDPAEFVDSEIRHIHRNGSAVWVRVRVSQVRDSGGSPQYLVACVEDITERRRAAEAVRESEDRFRIMADGCPTIMWVTNADGGIRFINRATRDFFGTSYEQVDGGKWQILLHPDDAPEYIGAFQSAVRERTPFRSEARVRRADGEWRWVVTYAEPRLSPDGEFLGHVGLSPDITERKEAEQALQRSEEKFRQLAENIREVFWVMPPAGNEVLYVSPAYEQVWGRTCDSIYRNLASWVDSIHPEDRAKACSLFTAQTKGESVEAEFRIRTPDGQEKWIRDRAFPIHDGSGQVVRVVGIAEDVSERKRYEAELIRAREGANAANRAKSSFLCLLQQNGDGGGRDIETVDSMAEFEGLADRGVWVHGDEEVLNQEVERAPVDGEAGDFDALDIDGGAAPGGADEGGDTDGTLAIQEFRHEPTGAAAGGTLQLAEIDECGACGEAGGGGAQLGIAHAGRRFACDHGVEFREGENNAGTGAQAAGFDGVQLLPGGGVVVICGGERCCD